jgi:hypothetical protein
MDGHTGREQNARSGVGLIPLSNVGTRQTAANYRELGGPFGTKASGQI